MLAGENPALRRQLEAYRARQTEAARNMIVPPAP
jgi:5-(carboxyamino)imidazole ribonucleotide mutase